MKKIWMLIFSIVLLTFGSSQAVPNLQLFIDGGTYDAASESWVSTSGTFDIYVIGANEALSSVKVSMALAFAKDDDPNGLASVDVDGSTYDEWIYGYAPIMTAPDFDPGDDLSKHGIFPTWFTEFDAGNFGLVGGVGDVQPQPDYYDPSIDGYMASSKTLGEYKVFSISATGTAFLHFDAYTLNPDGSIRYFAPFSHDATMTPPPPGVPEPASLILFAIGGMGLGIYRKFRK
ncbi:MAG: choice-of-anchor N protein [Candidatus Zixiibacteriota bacterium]